MDKQVVAITRYKEKYESVKEAIALSDAFKNLPTNARVVIKPNILFWVKSPFPPWGMITTASVIEDVVILLKEHGVSEITIVEGLMKTGEKDDERSSDTFEGLGFKKLKERYGVKAYDAMSRPFEKIAIDDDIELKMNKNLLNIFLIHKSGKPKNIFNFDSVENHAAC